MNQLKFSHDYEKLPLNWEGTQAVLFMAKRCDIPSLTARFPSLVMGDSKFRGEKGNYSFTFRDGILLMFYHLNSGKLFTTIRRYTKSKLKYYRDSMDSTFILCFER